ncbi:MAG: YceD family protein, partial [Pseudomonadales bacterium]
EGASLKGDLPIGGFQRLAASAECLGSVALALSFALDDQGRPRVKGSARVKARLVCQNCLAGFETELACRVDSVILADAEALDGLKQQEDGVLASGKLVRTADLVEDELLLSLPMAPRHEDGECYGETATAMATQAQADGEATAKPFASLKARLATQLATRAEKD